MSRGGFRGRGRGGGPMGGFGGRLDALSASVRDPHAHVGQLYPPLDERSIAFLPPPDKFETDLLENSLKLEETLRGGVDNDGLLGDLEERWCGWKIPEVKKTIGIEIETFSDFHALPGSSNTKKPFVLEVDKLKMDKEFFPDSLWNAYFAPEEEKKRASSTAQNKQKKRKRILDSDDEGGPDVEAEKESQASQSEDDFDYEDESDHQDYDANYFDNGEGDDDEGGEEDEGGGGGFDD